MGKIRNWVNGDVLVNAVTGQPFLFWKMEGGKIFSHCGIDSNGRFCMGSDDWTNPKGCRLANELEKKMLAAEMGKYRLRWVPELGYMSILTNSETFTEPLEHYGTFTQIVKCMEECGELIRALGKHLCNEGSYENVVEELADVDIMLSQMRYIFGHTEVDRVRTQKLARLKMRMEEEGCGPTPALPSMGGREERIRSNRSRKERKEQ